MNLVDFGKLVASLRKEHEDEQGAAWTQNKLAQECSLAAGSSIFNEDIISSIERGKKNLDSRTLLPLATALQLTSSERKEFFTAASGIDTCNIARKDIQPKQIFTQVIDRIRELYVPAALIDSYGNVLAVNFLLLELLEFPSAYGINPGTTYGQPHGYNLVRFIFSDDGSKHFQKLMGEGFTDFAYIVVDMFRTFSLAYRSTEYFRDLLIELRKYRLFRKYWSEIYFRENDRQFNSSDIRVTSSKWGAISLFITIRTAFTIAGDLHLAVFVPSDERASKACDKILSQIAEPMVFTLNQWPVESNLK